MERCAGVFAITCSVLLCCTTASARAELRVAVDWRGVSDADIARCGLSRLRAGTIDRLVEDGHAGVEESGAGGVQVVVASDGQAMRIQVSAGESVREQSVQLAEDCDATLALEVIARISELVREVGEIEGSGTGTRSGSESASELQEE